MNPRVSRSSALASKATGFPIAKIAARLAVGYLLDEIPNDITKATPASFEPTIDYVVTKIPRWAFEKLPGADGRLGTRMQSVGRGHGHRPDVLRVAAEGVALARAGPGRASTPTRPRRRSTSSTDDELLARIAVATPERIFELEAALRRGVGGRRGGGPDRHRPLVRAPGGAHRGRAARASRRRACARAGRLPAGQAARLLRRAAGLPARRDARRTCGAARLAHGVRATFKTVDTCAAEFEAFTPYHYATYEEEDEVRPSERARVIILGSGPNRIGQGIEFDYCCVHASMSLRDAGYETVMINCNPETVSTDYDTSDRLYFEPLTDEDVANVLDAELAAGGTVAGVIVVARRADAAEAGRLAPARAGARARARPPSTWPRTASAGTRCVTTLGDSAAARRDGDDARPRRSPSPGRSATRCSLRPSYVLGGRAMEIVYDDDGGAPRHAVHDHRRAGPRGRRHRRAARAGGPLLGGRRRGRRRRRARRRRRDPHRRGHGARRGGRGALGRLRLRAAAADAARRGGRASSSATPARWPSARRVRPHQRAVRREGRAGLRARGQPPGQPDGAVRGQGHRRAAGHGGRPGDGGPDAGRPARRRASSRRTSSAGCRCSTT